MNEEEYFICHWPRCVLWWCSVTKIGYEVKKIISLQDFPFSCTCNKFLFGWGKKKKLCKVKKSWSCSAEQFCDLHMTCAVLVWKDDESEFVEFCFFFIIHCLIQNAMCIPYKNILTRFHFSIFFNHLLIFYLINYWIKKCYMYVFTINSPIGKLIHLTCKSRHLW